ncbi:MAG: UDP-N-acetylmuramoyl-L-alanine--D-glutamate ligase, partial [Clostridiales bacterium]|nr:UDP-N-acetylmuramoyl-L-alanine--D-glutamate ligase [Clostridiales bacterium]
MYNCQNTLILGSGLSGKAARGLVERLGGHAEILADTRGVELAALGAILPKTSLVIISPGIPIKCGAAEAARRAGLPVISELEFAYSHCRSRLIAVTGTNGKSTTVGWIAHIVKTAGLRGEALGNIGVPFSQRVCDYDERALLALEVSSFQLEGVRTFRAGVSAILNITPDHLDRHGGLAGYTAAKTALYANALPDDRLVINADDTAAGALRPQTGDVYYFSLKQAVRGAYLNGERLLCLGDDLCAVSELPMPGEHNVSNALAAALCCRLSGIGADSVREGLTGFTGAAHRLQTVAKRGNITYIDDSKATNPASAAAAVKAMRAATVLILGGSDKGADFREIFRAMSSYIISVVVCGETRGRILADAAAEGCANICGVRYFREAVRAAERIARGFGGECNILLSPACASFDEF